MLLFLGDEDIFIKNKKGAVAAPVRKNGQKIRKKGFLTV